MRALVIGGTGHIGTYLVPQLVQAGMQVVVVSRGQQQPYRPDAAWRQVQYCEVDRDAAEQEGSFGTQMAALDPQVVIDLISYTRPSTAQLVEPLLGRLQQFIHCGTIWTYGYSEAVPTTEADPKRPWGDYGVNKKAIEDYLHERYRRDGFPACIFHPGHIVGPGWEFINPAGNRNPEVVRALAQGDEVDLPHLGLATLHHVHAADLAHLCLQLLVHRQATLGHSFNAVSERAVTLRGYAETMAAWFGRPARLRYVEWETWQQGRSALDVRLTGDHITHSPCHSMAKAQRLAAYQPRYTSLGAVHEALSWAIAHGEFADLPRLGGWAPDAAGRS